MNKQIEIFSRVAQITVNRSLNKNAKEMTADYAQSTINNVNNINETLIAAAVKLIKKAKAASNVDVEELTARLNEIIYSSVTSYMKKAG